MKLAPIVLFVYNRPLHTRKTIEALQKNALAKDSELFIFSDGAKSEQAGPAVAEVRAYLKSISGFKNVTLFERTENAGLAASVQFGVRQVLGKYGRIIVLEDDIVTMPGFLTYMNAALTRYEGDLPVMQVNGFMFPEARISGDTAVFLSFINSWGWGTWARAWDSMEADFEKIYQNISKSLALRKKFNLNGHYDYQGLLRATLDGKMDSWAILWYAAVFQAKGLALYPPKSLVLNIGFDGSGVHDVVTKLTGPSQSTQQSRPVILPEKIQQYDSQTHIEKSVGKMIKLPYWRLWLHRFKIFFYE